MTIAWEIPIEGFTESFESRGDAVIARLKAEMQAETINLLAYVEDEKLSGQVLHQRSGALKRSGYTAFENSEDEIAGILGFGSGPSSSANTVPYAAIHEYGGTIHVPAVAGKLMVFEKAGQTIFTTRHVAFDVQMPARPYLEPSIDENREAILGRLQTAVNEELA